MVKPMRAWAIVGPDGNYPYLICGLPELFRVRHIADSQNIDRLNGSRVIRVEIKAVRTNNKRRKR